MIRIFNTAKPIVLAMAILIGLSVQVLDAEADRALASGPCTFTIGALLG